MRLTSLFVGMCLLGSVGIAPQVGTAPLKKIEILAQSDGMRPGETMKLGVRVSLAREFHVNSHVPSTEYLIPTTLETVSLDGLLSGDWEFPEGEMRRFPFSGEPLRVYEGSFLIRGFVSAPEDAVPSQKQVRLSLRYQACTTERCYPPRKEEISVALRVVPRGTTTRPLHPEVFPAATP